jgi:hypothetical protein
MPSQLDSPPLARPLKPMAGAARKSGYPRRTPERREVRVQPVRAAQDCDKILARKDVKGAIAFSLFGTNPMYLQGGIRNAELASEIYPGWKCVFYCGPEVPKAITLKLGQLGAEVRGAVEGIANQMFWRFCIADDPAFTHFIIRDTDSRLSLREARAAAEWIESGKAFHSCRDHPCHSLPLGGGLWGAKHGVIPGMREAIIASKLASRPYKREDSYSLDQTFLTRYVWPIAKLSCTQHDSCTRHLFPGSKPFPDGCKFGQPRFTGEIVNADDTPHNWHWQMRINFME